MSIAPDGFKPKILIYGQNSFIMAFARDNYYSHSLTARAFEFSIYFMVKDRGN